MKTKLLPLMLLAGIALSGCGTADTAADSFVRVENGQFLLNDKPYYFIGTNFWYGPILGSQGPDGDRGRLARELDALRDRGVTNLRVLVGADGEEGVPCKIEPILQTAPGEYDDALLDGLDYFMREAARRDMKVVLYLTNSWEWSGGYSQYLMWAGEEKAPIPGIDGWNPFREYVAGFIPNERAREMFADHVRFIVGRTNRYTNRKYSEDPAIFSWQICNEPRAFSDENKEEFARWIGSTARLIRSLDPNHMISTGSEGLFGCEVDTLLTERIHAFPEISYVNLHIWPYNWQWATAGHLDEEFDNARQLTHEYLECHLDIAERLNKPVVVEEFGFPRDSVRFDRGTPTRLRDAYYTDLLDRVIGSKAEGGLLAGCNFWGWAGEARPAHHNWQRGDDFCCDPAHEPQGFYCVYDDDTTAELIRDANRRLEATPLPGEATKVQ